MANKRFTRTVSAVLLAAIVLSGCSGKKKEGKDGKDGNGAPDASVTEREDAAFGGNEGASDETGEKATSAPTAAPTETPTPTPAPKPEIENISNNEEGHYTFQKHVFGTAYLAQFGEKYRDAMFAFCDAVYSGQDTFACPDEETYGWCVGRLSTYFCPIASKYVTAYSPDGSPSYKDGTGYIFYTIPKDEYMKKEKEFEDSIVSIINDCISDDYTDMEKVLAFYEYMCRNYTYDYEMNARGIEGMEDQSAYRCLVEKKGICCEIAALYNFLLLQVGVDSEEMGGSANGEGHSWLFVTIDGESYHVDATWGLTEKSVYMDYFMMTDKLRADRDGFATEKLTIAAWGDQSRKNYRFASTDEKYKDLWKTYYIGMDREDQEIVYENWDGTRGRFYYGSDVSEDGLEESTQAA